MEGAVAILGIILSSLGIIISFSSLIFAIIYLIKIHKLQKLADNLESKMTILDSIKEVLILQCVLFPKNGSAIRGKECIDFIRQKYNCDEMNAIKIYYGSADCRSDIKENTQL